jgi:hypothetical protein
MFILKVFIVSQNEDYRVGGSQTTNSLEAVLQIISVIVLVISVSGMPKFSTNSYDSKVSLQGE